MKIQDVLFADFLPGEKGRKLDKQFAQNNWKLQRWDNGESIGYQVFFGKGVQVDNRKEYGFLYLYDEEELLGFAEDYYRRLIERKEMHEDTEKPEAVLTVCSESDGFTRSVVMEMLDKLALQDAEEIDPIYLFADSSVIFGFIRLAVSDVKLSFMTGENSEFGRQAIAVANDMALETESGCYSFAGVQTLMLNQSPLCSAKPERTVEKG